MPARTFKTVEGYENLSSLCLVYGSGPFLVRFKPGFRSFFVPLLVLFRSVLGPVLGPFLFLYCSFIRYVLGPF